MIGAGGWKEAALAVSWVMEQLLGLPRKEALMASILTDALPVLTELAPAFSQPTFRRAQLLVVAAVLSSGRRTIANLLRTLGALVPGQASSYHRVLSQARWSGLRLAALLLRHFWPTGRIRLVSRFVADASLYEAAPVVVGKKPSGRPRGKGAKLPAPQAVVATAMRQRLTVSWYGGGRRRVEVVSAVGHWYKAGQGLVAVRWVYVHDVAGTHRDDYLYSTDTSMTAKEIIEEYTGRWNIETTFQEARADLGLETTRGWKRETVLRAAPCLLGLYTLVSVWYWQLPESVKEDWGVLWAGKESMTFSDAITAVRRWLWSDWVFATGGHDVAFAKLPNALQEVLLTALTPAA
jgi:hypothetical protein